MRPISRAGHGLIDYAFVIFDLVSPKLFGLSGSTKWLVRGFGMTQLGMNALTDHPYALKPVVPLSNHHDLEKWSGPAVLAASLVLGGWKNPKNRAFLVTYGIVATAVFNLTNWRDESTARLSKG